MDGINDILQAEQDAKYIRQKGKETAEALFLSAEDYRQNITEDARRRGEEEKARLISMAHKRAQARLNELGTVSSVRDEELKARAEQAMEQTAAWIAEKITEV